MYSAIKKDGQPLYKLARQGIDVALEARSVTIHEIKVLMYNQESAMLEVLSFLFFRQIFCQTGSLTNTHWQNAYRIGVQCSGMTHLASVINSQNGKYAWSGIDYELMQRLQPDSTDIDGLVNTIKPV